MSALTYFVMLLLTLLGHRLALVVLGSNDQNRKARKLPVFSVFIEAGRN